MELMEESKYFDAIQLLRSHPEDVWSVYYTAIAYSHIGDFRSARTHFIEASKLDWHDMSYENNPYFHIGALDLIEGNYESALRQFNLSKIGVDRSNLMMDWRLYRWSGIAHMLSGNFVSALECLCCSSFIQMRSTGSINMSDDRLLLEYCAKKTDINRDYFEIQAFGIEIKPHVYENMCKLVKEN